MPKLYIPALRDQLRLTKDWTFTMPERHVDYTLTEWLHGAEPHWWADAVKGHVGDPFSRNTIPAGTVLSVDRIYIRQGAKDFDSITFRIKKEGSKAGCRFWVPLDQANTIEFENV